MDAREIKSLGIEFDKILLDAPCSGSGIIITDPSRKITKSISDLYSYCELQVELLENAIGVLRSKGTIVYSTCSLEPEENELVITKVMEKNDLKIEKINIEGDSGLLCFQDYSFSSDLDKAKRLYPHRSFGEGFFIVKMVKQ
jgi:16S rRNA C967 or C1407 C5-methylase (RsmB/RsmF family)